VFFIVKRAVTVALSLRLTVMLSDEPGPAKPSSQPGWFATTHWSVVLAAGQTASPQAEAALEKLCGAYWYPLYAYVRRQGHSPHDAQDLTQGFFAVLLEKNYVELADRAKGKFRSFLLTALNHFLGDHRDRANALKRGGGKVIISLEEQTAEGRWSLEPATDLSPEKEYEKLWAVTVLQQALIHLRDEADKAGRDELFEELKSFLEGEARPGDYAAVGAKLGMTANSVAVAVHRLRQRYRELVRAEIANTVASAEEIEDELRHLFAVLA
jgi:RNA polymerase sigma-70 factor (ECF subfamily)